MASILFREIVINLLIIAGNVGKDPESRTTPSGMQITTFSVATESRSKGEKVTTWHNCTAFNKTAEIAAQYVRKGSKVCVRGRIDNQQWEGKDGQTKYKTVCIVDELQLMGDKAGGQSAPRQQPAPPPADDFNDDIPF